MNWFGKSWGAPMCDPDDWVPTPLGATCYHCDELVDEDDQGIIQMGLLHRTGWTPIVMHLNCFLRTSVTGSIAHVEGRCSCCGGSENANDLPPEMTVRQEADAAVALWESLHRGR